MQSGLLFNIIELIVDQFLLAVKIFESNFQKSPNFFEDIDHQMNEFIQKQQVNLSVFETCSQPQFLKFLEMVLREITIGENCHCLNI
jgi:hypothetical protein